MSVTKKIVLQWLIIVLVLLPCLNFTAIATAQTTSSTNTDNTRTLTLADGKDLADLRLSGFSDRQDVTVNVPPNWELAANSYIEVKLSHSPLLDPQVSSLTLLLNDSPVSSLRLDPSNQTNYTWHVALPAGTKPKKGTLRFGFAASMRTNSLVCPPSDDQSDWALISAQSPIQLKYSATPLTRLADIPQILFGSHALQDRKITVVLAAKPTARQLTQASQILTWLGGLAGFDGLDTSVSYGNLQSNSSAGLHQIIIGGPDIFPLLSGFKLPVALSGSNFVSDGKPLDQGVGVVELASTNETNSSQSLIISGSDDDAVDRALQALLDNDSLSLMDNNFSLIQPGNHYVPSTVLPVSNAEVVNSGRSYFADLDLQTHTVYGSGTQSIDYYFSVLGDKVLTNDAQLGLDYSFSGVADPRRSSMTVVVNDVALQAVPLSNDNSDRPSSALPSAGNGTLQTQHLDIKIPKDVLHAGENHLALRFGLYVTRDLNSSPCGESSSFNDIWGTIYRTSTLDIQLEDAKITTPSLAELPFPFVGTNASTMLVLPEKPTSTDLHLAAQIMAEFGRQQSAQANNQLLLIAADQLSDKSQLNNENVILIGTPDNNSLVNEVNSKLPIAWNNNTTRTLNTQRGLHLSISNGNQLKGLVEATSSPWNAQKALLVVIANPASSDDGEAVTTAIARHLYIDKYTGNVMVINDDGTIVTINTLDKTQNPQVISSVTPTANTNPAVTLAPGSNNFTTPKAVATVAASQTASQTPSAAKPNAASSGGSTPLLLAVFVIGLVLLSISGYYALSSLRKRKK